MRVTLTKTNDDVTLGGTDLSDGKLTFDASNWDTVQTVTVSAAEDDDAADETDTITLSSDTDGVSDQTVQVNIADDETLGLTVFGLAGEHTRRRAMRGRSVSG